MSAGASPGLIRLSLLDEQALIRDALARLLGGAGFSVVSQHGEAHGFLLGLTREPPDVALVDLSLTASDGMTVLQEAHQLSPAVRLLAMAPRLEHRLMDECFRAGASGYLDRSASRFDALVDALHAIARGNNVFPAHAVESLLRAAGQRNEQAELLRTLSEREREVLAYLSVGADNPRIAALLRISERTVKAHVSNLYRKLGQENRTQLALLARQSGVRPPANYPPRAVED